MSAELFGSDFLLPSWIDDHFPVMLTQTGSDPVIFKKSAQQTGKINIGPIAQLPILESRKETLPLAVASREC